MVNYVNCAWALKECNSRFKNVFTKTQLLIFDQSIRAIALFIVLLFILTNRKIRNSGLIFRESIRYVCWRVHYCTHLLNPKFVPHSISWTHIDEMISEAGLKRSFDSYFIDYAFMNDVSEVGHHRVFHSSAISTTKHSVEIEDDCLVYSVVLGVVMKNESECANVLYSRPKFLWVRYYSDYLETFEVYIM